MIYASMSGKMNSKIGSSLQGLCVHAFKELTKVKTNIMELSSQ